MTSAALAICRRLGRRPAGPEELTDAERRALEAGTVEDRRRLRPIERRG